MEIDIADDVAEIAGLDVSQEWQLQGPLKMVFPGPGDAGGESGVVDHAAVKKVPEDCRLIWLQVTSDVVEGRLVGFQLVVDTTGGEALGFFA